MGSIKTQGAQIRVSDGASPIVWGDVGCVTDFQGPSGSRQVIDTTCLDSTGREKNVGIPDFGQVSMNLIFDPADTVQIGLWSKFKSGERHEFRIVIPTSPEDYIQFHAYVLNFSLNAQIDDVFRASATLEIDGAVTDSF